MFTLGKRVNNINLHNGHKDKVNRKSKLTNFFSFANVTGKKPPESTATESSSHDVGQQTSILKKTDAPVIGIIGAKGGVGATTFAINLATKLVDYYANTVLIDANLQQPDIALSLGFNPKYNLNDLIQRKNRFDENVLDACLEKFNFDTGNLGILSPPLELESSLQTEISSLGECVDLIKSHKDLVVIDLPKILDQNLLSLIDYCDKIILVSDPSLNALSASKRWVSIFNELAVPEDNLSFVLNKLEKKQKQIESDALNALKIKTHWNIASSYAQLEEACLNGEPLVISNPKDAYVKSINHLCEELSKWVTEEGDGNV